MSNGEYPQDISEDEARLGFRLLLVDGIVASMGSRMNPVPVPIVACRLSSCDILIKISHPDDGSVVYSLRRWGIHKDGVGVKEWIPVFTPQRDLGQFFLEYNAGTHFEIFHDRIIPSTSAFTYRAI
jgi:hypothetical protein